MLSDAKSVREMSIKHSVYTDRSNQADYVIKPVWVDQ